jgi:hypothetical protein
MQLPLVVGDGVPERRLRCFCLLMHSIANATFTAIVGNET